MTYGYRKNQSNELQFFCGCVRHKLREEMPKNLSHFVIYSKVFHSVFHDDFYPD